MGYPGSGHPVGPNKKERVGGMRTLAPTVLLASVFLWGCASGGGSSSSDTRRDPNRISPEEIQSLPAGTAFDAVQRLRPNWLRSRGTLSVTTSGTGSLPRVFVDDRDYGSMNSLHDLNLDSVAEITRMSAQDATTRYGTGYAGGSFMSAPKGSPDFFNSINCPLARRIRRSYAETKSARRRTFCSVCLRRPSEAHVNLAI